MKKQLRFKLLSLMLILCILFSLLPGSIIAVEDTPTTNSGVTLSDVIAGFADPSELYDPLDESSVPEIIGYEEAVSNNHVMRLYEDEGRDLNTVVFLNFDGTKTMYTFDFPVKYVDSNGQIQDITLEIADSSSEEGAFETASNAAVTTFSSRVTDGISLTGNNTDITLVPVIPSIASGGSTYSTNSIDPSSAVPEARRVDKKTIEYRYDNSTTIEYSLTYTGFKEDIVVNEYTGQTEFDFRLYTNGYALEEINGSYFLVDDNSEIKASIGDIVIFTADEKNNSMGEIVPTTIRENEEYLLTIVVDADYLSDPKTAYPIRIDPTVEIIYDYSGAGAIEDITISTNTAFSGSYGSLYVGRRSTEGIARILMRFPALDLSDLDGAEVNSATVRIRDLMCEDTELDISCYAFTGNVWDASSATWSSVSANSYSTLLSTNTISWSVGNAVSPIHWYSFDITKAVQGWIDGNFSQDKGIIFKASSSVENGSTINNRTFGSYNRASYKPQLTVTYTPAGTQVLANDTYYINNKHCGDYAQYTSSGGIAPKSGLLSSLGTSIQWKIQKLSGGYVIRAVNDNTKYLGISSSASSTFAAIVTVSDSTIPQRCFWSVSVVSGGIRLKNLANSEYLYSYGASLHTSSTLGTSGTSTYNTRIWRVVSTSTYGNNSSYSNREFTANSTISNLELAKNASSNIVINKYLTNELWATPTDFTYSFSASGIATISNGVTSTGSTLGGTKVTATHKVTERVKSFYIIVGFSSTISSTPLAENIITGLNEPYNIWPASEESMYYGYSATERLEALIAINEAASATAAGGYLISNPDAAMMLTHFLKNSGDLYTLDMGILMRDWDTAQSFRNQHLNVLIQMAEASATYSSKSLRTISSIGCTVSESTNWGRAVGSYSVSISCMYKKTSSTEYTMAVTYELHDCYDWNPNITSMGNLPVSPAEMWELHHGGFGKNYEVFGSISYTITWTAGQRIESGAQLV